MSNHTASKSTVTYAQAYGIVAFLVILAGALFTMAYFLIIRADVLYVVAGWVGIALAMIPVYFLLEIGAEIVKNRR